MRQFKEVWAVDFEFRAGAGERPWPVCMVARELRRGTEIRLWREDLLALSRAPFDTGPAALFVAYYASAELGCFLELGWPLPINVLDLFAEHRCESNGVRLDCGNGLLGAMAWRGVNASLDAGEKDTMRRLVLDQSSWNETEKRAILTYCAGDVVALGALLPKMLPTIDLARALHRGRYMAAAARMERVGVPIDADTLGALRANWKPIKLSLISEVDADFDVYEKGSFKQAKFLAWLDRQRIRWPLLPTGKPKLDATTFRDMAKFWPVLHPLHELRVTLGELRLNALEVGEDGRNRTLLSAFSSKTGRNQPSNSKFVFGPARWIRGLIKPAEGCGLAYIDWSAQELALAAALSGDERMIEAYSGGDPYLAFARAAGLAPEDATKTTHAALRERCKVVCLGTLYGMEAHTLSWRLGVSPAEAQELLRLHRSTYRHFWRWNEDVVTRAILSGGMHTCFGWRVRCAGNVNPRSLMNWPMQAHGAEMMRLAAIAATEAGIEVAAPVHDAFLVCAPVERLEADIAKMRGLMQRASASITGGLQCRTDASVVRWPDRYMDPRGESMWQRVVGLSDRETEDEQRGGFRLGERHRREQGHELEPAN